MTLPPLSYALRAHPKGAALLAKSTESRCRACGILIGPGHVEMRAVDGFCSGCLGRKIGSALRSHR